LRSSSDGGTLGRMTGAPMLSSLEIALRLLAAFACGAVIGLNREFRHKPAGFRTFTLVSIGSAVVMIAIENGHGMPESSARVIQGILTGIGFLGAGVIFRRESPNKITGLTTAAAVWLTAALGVAAGMGQYILAGMTTVLSLVLLLFGRKFEHLLADHKKNGAEPGGDNQDAP
jgi:putative Mg2+ transporter-C (MgtC) family protein